MSVQQAIALMRDIKEQHREAVKNKDFYRADQLKYRKKKMRAYFSKVKQAQYKKKYGTK